MKLTVKSWSDATIEVVSPGTGGFLTVTTDAGKSNVVHVPAVGPEDWWEGWSRVNTSDPIYVSTYWKEELKPHGKSFENWSKDLKGATAFLNFYAHYAGVDANDSWGWSFAMPIEKLKEFYDYYMAWVPKGGPHHGPIDSFDAASTCHAFLRLFFGNPCSFYCVGLVSWSSEKPHGFILVLAYPDNDPTKWELYLIDPWIKIPPTPFRSSPYTIHSFSGYGGG